MTSDRVNSIMGNKLVIFKETEKKKGKKMDFFFFIQCGELVGLKKVLELMQHFN